MVAQRWNVGIFKNVLLVYANGSSTFPLATKGDKFIIIIWMWSHGDVNSEKDGLKIFRYTVWGKSLVKKHSNCYPRFDPP